MGMGDTSTGAEPGQNLIGLAVEPCKNVALLVFLSPNYSVYRLALNDK